MRWLVEVKNGGFHDVGAEAVRLTEGGALAFFDETGDVSVAYSPGAWVSVAKDADE